MGFGMGGELHRLIDSGWRARKRFCPPSVLADRSMRAEWQMELGVVVAYVTKYDVD